METCIIPTTRPASPMPPLEIPVSEKLASGLSTSSSEANVWQPQTFTPESWRGNDYMHARYYSSALGRFLSVDPLSTGRIGSSQSWNRYSYVENNPLMFVDPGGQSLWARIKAFFGFGQTEAEQAAAEQAQADAAEAANASNEAQREALDELGLEYTATTVERAPVNYAGQETESSTGTITGRGDHAVEVREEAQQGDARRQVGDANRVVREGQTYLDTETGHTVHVRGDRVVIVDSETGVQVTQFKNPRANTRKRIRSGKWVPVGK